MFEKYPDVVSVKQLCDMLNICKPSAYKLLRENVIGYRKIGDKYIIPKRSIINFLTKID